MMANSLSKKQQRWQKKERTNDMIKGKDDIWEDGKPDDVVVVVMGPTGVGKSTFVEHLLRGAKNNQTVKIGEDLDSCTVNLQPIPLPVSDIPRNIPVRGSRLVIVDTPGFDDTYESDSEILRRIAVWLASSYGKNMKLGGVIYLHDISQARMLGTTRRNFEMFQELCGDSAAKAMILGTTKWGLVQFESAENREKQLRDKFWNGLIDTGAQTARFKNTPDSAWEMVGTLIDAGNKLDTIHAQKRALQIQQELVEFDKIIPTTEAGKKLRYTLQEVLEMQKNSTPQSGGRDYDAKMKEKVELIDNLVGQIAQLKAPLWHRIKALF